MYLNAVDWGIVIAFWIALTGLAIFTRRYNRGVADFLAANRSAGRYLLCIAGGMALTGPVGVVTQMQAFYNVGLAGLWWHHLYVPTTMILILAGWIVYRFRETRVLTLAQFFEVRYSRRFRIFTGILAFFSGVINFGVFPAVSASFFIYYCGLPEHIGIIPTYYLLLILLMGITVFFTLSGGQITAIATGLPQGVFLIFVFIAIFIIVLKNIGFNTILDGLKIASSGKSMLNPVDIQNNKGFTLWYYVILAFMQVYSYKAWQSDQGYNCAGRTAHEAKMAGILGGYRWFAFLGGLVLIPLCAYTIMHHPAYADKAARAQSILDKISNPEIRDQMITPVVMHQFVPFGLKGCFAAAMLAALISNFSSQLHSWGSIFVQDVILPLKKTRLSPKAHLLLLKASVVMVAVFVIIFSCLFRQTQRFQTYVMVSATVYLGGAGIALVGGLYWRKGTTAAAWTAMLTGAAISVFAIIIEQCWVEIYGKNFPIDFKWWAAIAMSVSSCFYIVVSLLSSGNFNIEKMLHRGQYRVKDDNEVETSEKRKSWLEILGVSKEFTLFDKCVWWFSMSQTIFLFLYALIVTIVYLTAGFSDKVWRNCHLVWLWMMIILLPIPVAIWLTIGGFHDYISFFRNLRKAKQNALDDGSVVDHHNLSDES